jgi:hypothetical protein
LSLSLSLSLVIAIQRLYEGLAQWLCPNGMGFAALVPEKLNRETHKASNRELARGLDVESGPPGGKSHHYDEKETVGGRRGKM